MRIIIPIIMLCLISSCGDGNPLDSVFGDPDIDCIELTGSCERNMFGNFKAMGSVSNICGDESYSSVTIEFEFSGGTEQRTFNKDLSAGHKFKRLWSTKIKGHKNEEFISMKLISVD